MVGSPLVIIPTYNEAENISEMITAVLGLPSSFHILVVDDASPDGTAQKVRERQEVEAVRLHLLERAGKEGLGVAYQAGFAWAMERDYPRVCQMDADFSHDPADLERLVAAAEEADLVLGVRYIPGGRVEGWSKRRWLLSRGGNLYTRWVTGSGLSDLTGGFKCYRRETLQTMDWSQVQSSGYTFQMETTMRVKQMGLRVKEIPICFRERQRGSSKIASFRTSLETLWLATSLGWQYRRRYLLTKSW